MTEVSWQTDAPTEQTSKTADARRQAHNALHWLARLAHTYRGPEENNSHVELVWDEPTGTLRTRDLGDGVTLEVRVSDLELQFCENGEPVPHILSFEERTPAHVEAWILVELLHRSLDRDRFSKELPYSANDLMLGDNEEHEVEIYKEELEALNAWLRNAVPVLKALRHDLDGELGVDLANCEIVCWPQTFQLGIEIPLLQGSGADSLRAGLSAGDALRTMPFFFVGTRDEATKGDFDASSVLSVQRVASDKLSADDVLNFLKTQIADNRKRLAG